MEAEARADLGGECAILRGRPPFGYHCVNGAWRHTETGAPFDPQRHATGVAARKAACMYRKYWEGGGREMRLAKYTKKRMPKAQQLTLCEVPAMEAVPLDARLCRAHATGVHVSRNSPTADAAGVADY